MLGLHRRALPWSQWYRWCRDDRRRSFSIFRILSAGRKRSTPDYGIWAWFRKASQLSQIHCLRSHHLRNRRLPDTAPEWRRLRSFYKEHHIRVLRNPVRAWNRQSNSAGSAADGYQKAPAAAFGTMPCGYRGHRSQSYSERDDQTLLHWFFLNKCVQAPASAYRLLKARWL